MFSKSIRGGGFAHVFMCFVQRDDHACLRPFLFEDAEADAEEDADGC